MLSSNNSYNLRVSIQLSIGPDLPPVKGDPFKLEQVFINLIDNAMKYMEKGGITIDNEPLRTIKLSLLFKTPGRYSTGAPLAHL